MRSLGIEGVTCSRRNHLPGWRCHSNADIQLTSTLYEEGFAEIGATPSIRTVGDLFDYSLPQPEDRNYQSQPVRGPEHPAA